MEVCLGGDMYDSVHSRVGYPQVASERLNLCTFSRYLPFPLSLGIPAMHLSMMVACFYTTAD